jgi:hypothetical protein
MVAGDAAVPTESETLDNDADNGGVAQLRPWPPADANCSLRLTAPVKTFFHSSGCACAAAPATPVWAGMTVGQYCADDPLARYAAAFEVPVYPLPASASDPAVDRAWTRLPMHANPPLGWDPQFTRRAAFPFSPDTDYTLDGGRGIAFFNVQVGRSHGPDGGDPAAILHDMIWSYWPGSQPSESYGADLEFQGRPAYVYAHKTAEQNVLTGSDHGGLAYQYAFELGLVIVDGSLTVALMGMIPLADAGVEPDPALVCEIEAIIASFRFEAMPSAPSSVCDPTW